MPIENYIFILIFIVHINLLQIAGAACKQTLWLFHCLYHVLYIWKYEENNLAASCINYQSYPEAKQAYSARWLIFALVTKHLQRSGLCHYILASNAKYELLLLYFFCGTKLFFFPTQLDLI